MYALIAALLVCQAETLPPPDIPACIWDSHAAALCSSDALPIPGEIPLPLQAAIERFSARNHLWDGPGWNWANNTSGEIQWVRNHLWLGYPSLNDLKQFPSPCEVKVRLDDARSHIAALEAFQAVTWNKDYVGGMILEARCAMGPWLRLHAAQTHTGADKTPARSELSALRVLIGEDAYRAGLLPMHIPPSHYRRER